MCPLLLHAALLSLPPSYSTLSLRLLLLLSPAVAGAAGIIATTAGIRRTGTAVSALAYFVVFNVGAPEHAMGHVARAGHFAYSNLI